MNYTDTQLKQALAKMLTGVIYFGVVTKNLEWHAKDKCHRPVYDTELLHLCWLVEDALNFDQQLQLAEDLYNNCCAQTDGKPSSAKETYLSVHATWQQRTIALCSVKGIEI